MRPSRAVARNAKELCRITLACLCDLVSNFTLQAMPPSLTCVNGSITNRFMLMQGRGRKQQPPWTGRSGGSGPVLYLLGPGGGRPRRFEVEPREAGGRS
jgi:hypothetical protein